VPVQKLNSFIHELDKDADGNPFWNYEDCEDDMFLPDDVPTQSFDFSGPYE